MMLANNYCLVVIFCCVNVVNSDVKFRRKPLPDYIKPCSASAPDLSKCVVKHAASTIPSLLKGDPKFRLQPLDPFLLEKVELRPSHRLSLILRDLKFYGFNNLKLIGAEVDLKRRHVKFEIVAKTLSIESKYNISGQILVIPISGEGPAHFKFDDCFIDYSFDFDLLKRADGYTYISNLRPQTFFNVSRIHFQLDNLFNGNRELGDSTNKVLNDNPQEVLNDFREAITEILKVITTTIANAYLTVIPYEEIFLP